MFFSSNKKVDNRIDGFSHLGEGASFEGEIHCKGEIEINISAKTLRILETGKVTGHVNAERVEILGCMLGNTSSLNIHVGEKGVVRGDLRFEENLSVNEGADILGHVQKAKKDKNKKFDSDKIRYLEHNQRAS
ncbi:MAG: polymer-forming cytoskeletal protein [Candidatus Fonsibacter ubiquis]|nr:polymer-forming cytoskeletal protein [Candidatus Fonsibacter ubiquis]